MTLRIERRDSGQSAVLHLIGELRSQDVKSLSAQIADAPFPVILDLAELSVVDLTAVRFLLDCQSRGINIVNCQPYIREWMKREKEKE